MNLIPASPEDQKDEMYMRRALELAREAGAHGEVPVGCVVVCDDSIAGEGNNTRESSLDPTGHAEVLAIRAASQKLQRWRLVDCTLYVTLEPCFMCAGAIVNARVGRVVFGALDPKAGACSSLANVIEDARLNHRCKVTNNVLADESSVLLKEFFKLRRSQTTT